MRTTHIVAKQERGGRCRLAYLRDDGCWTDYGDTLQEGGRRANFANAREFESSWRRLEAATLKGYVARSRGFVMTCRFR